MTQNLPGSSAAVKHSTSFGGTDPTIKWGVAASYLIFSLPSLLSKFKERCFGPIKRTLRSDVVSGLTVVKLMSSGSGHRDRETFHKESVVKLESRGFSLKRPG